MKSLILLLLVCFSIPSFSQDQEESEMDSEVITLPTEQRFFYGSLNLATGQMLFAPSASIDAEFNTLELGYVKIRESKITTVVNLQHMFNQSKSNFNSISGGLGYSFGDEVKFIPMATLSLSLFKENSPSQNIMAFGKGLGLKANVIYNFNPNVGLLLNVEWNHLMFSNGYKPKDPATEMVYDYVSTGVGIFWEL